MSNFQKVSNCQVLVTQKMNHILALLVFTLEISNQFDEDTENWIVNSHVIYKLTRNSVIN
jgi:hypothetical protein